MFCWNDRRIHLYDSLRKFARVELAPYAPSLDLVIGGSFLSDKPNPDDIESTLIVPPVFILGPTVSTSAAHVLSTGSGRSHDQLKETYEVDFYISLDVPGFSNFCTYFQYVGEKTAVAKALQPTDIRGVLQVEQWAAG